MVKLGLEITEKEDNVNVKLTDPTKKQLAEATENEKLIAQRVKDRFVEIVSLLETEE